MTQHRTREEQVHALASNLAGVRCIGSFERESAERHITEAEARATASLRAENERLREALKPFAGAAYFFDADGNDFERDYEDDYTLGAQDEEDVMNSLTVGHLRQAASVLSISPAAGRTDQEGEAMGHRPLSAELSDAVRDVLAELERQRQVEGWTTERDDQYHDLELVRAAMVYAFASSVRDMRTTVLFMDMWPWDVSWFKPGPRDIVKASALMLAEAERRYRTADHEGSATKTKPVHLAGQDYQRGVQNGREAGITIGRHQAQAVIAAAIKLAWSEEGTASILNGRDPAAFDPWPEMDALLTALDQARPGWRTQTQMEEGQMPVTSDQLADIICASIADAMDQEERGNE